MSKEISWPKVIWWCLPFWLLPHHPSVWLRQVEAIEEVSYVMSYNWICSTNLPLLLLKSEQTSILISSDISISRGWYMSCDASLVTWKHERYPSFLTDNSSQNEINMPTHNDYHCIFSQKAKRRKSGLRSKRSHTNSPSSQVSLWKKTSGRDTFSHCLHSNNQTYFAYSHFPALEKSYALSVHF